MYIHLPSKIDYSPKNLIICASITWLDNFGRIIVSVTEHWLFLLFETALWKRFAMDHGVQVYFNVCTGYCFYTILATQV